MRSIKFFCRFFQKAFMYKKNYLYGGVYMKNNIVTYEMVKESVAMTRDFIREYLGREGFKTWSCQQHKLLSLFLSKIDYTEGNNNIDIELTYDEIIEGFGWDYSKNIRNMKEILKSDIDYMMGNCKMWLKGRDTTSPYYAENLIISCKLDSSYIIMRININFMIHLENLFDLQYKKRWQFLIMPISDLKLFSSKYSQLFFYEFITCGKIGGSINSHQLSTKAIKYLVGLDEDSYMRKEQTFDRSNFEKRVIIPALKDIDATEMVDIIKTENGNYFEKYKKRGKIVGYKFRYRIYNIYQIYDRRNKKNRNTINDNEINTFEVVYDYNDLPFEISS